jgi:acyl-CoA thioester hydrolase
MNTAPHRIEARVSYAETDAMGIVYYANYLRWFEMGRTELMRAVGIAYKAMEDQGVYLPASEVFCKYHASARYDDVIIIETSVEFLKRASIQFAYRLRRKEDGAELVTGWTLHAFVDGEGKIVRVPASLKEKLKFCFPSLEKG